MGDTFSLGLDDVVPLVDPSQQHVAEVNRPDPVVDLLKPDGVLLERVGEEQQPLPQADGAGVGHALHDEVPGVLDPPERGQSAPAVPVASAPAAGGARASRPPDSAAPGTLLDGTSGTSHSRSRASHAG